MVGLVTAALLAKCQDMEIFIFESKSEIRTIGAGIAIWKPYWDMLAEVIDIEAEGARDLRVRTWSEGAFTSSRSSMYGTDIDSSRKFTVRYCENLTTRLREKTWLSFLMALDYYRGGFCLTFSRDLLESMRIVTFTRPRS